VRHCAQLESEMLRDSCRTYDASPPSFSAKRRILRLQTQLWTTVSSSGALASHSQTCFRLSSTGVEKKKVKTVEEKATRAEDRKERDKRKKQAHEQQVQRSKAAKQQVEQKRRSSEGVCLRGVVCVCVALDRLLSVRCAQPRKLSRQSRRKSSSA
jgi:hypothetical protein